MSAKKLRFLEDLSAEACASEAKGPKLLSSLASDVTAFMPNKPEKSKLRSTMEELLPPANCPGLEPITELCFSDLFYH